MNGTEQQEHSVSLKIDLAIASAAIQRGNRRRAIRGSLTPFSRARLVSIWIAASFLCVESAGAATSLPPIYEPKPGACYVQLKHSKGKSPYAEGGDYPVCAAVLANLNKFCGEPPQYNRRKLHPTTLNLQEPEWRPLAAKENIDIVREILTSTLHSPENRALLWREEAPRLERLAQDGRMRLWTADIDVNSDGKVETIYMLENRYPDAPPVNNHPQFILAHRGERIAMPAVLGPRDHGDVWRYKDRWFVISPGGAENFDLRVGELVGSTFDIGAVTRCTIQHIDDYKRK